MHQKIQHELSLVAPGYPSAEACAFDIDMQHCPNCGAGELRIIAAILERAVIQKILRSPGLDPQLPPKGRAREAGLHFAA